MGAGKLCPLTALDVDRECRSTPHTVHRESEKLAILGTVQQHAVVDILPGKDSGGVRGAYLINNIQGRGPVEQSEGVSDRGQGLRMALCKHRNVPVSGVNKSACGKHSGGLRIHQRGVAAGFPRKGHAGTAAISAISARSRAPLLKATRAQSSHLQRAFRPVSGGPRQENAGSERGKQQNIQSRLDDCSCQALAPHPHRRGSCPGNHFGGGLERETAERPPSSGRRDRALEKLSIAREKAVASKWVTP